MKPWRLVIIRYANTHYVKGTLYRPRNLLGDRHVRTFDHRGGPDPAIDVVLALEEHIPAGIPYIIDDPMNPDPGRWTNWSPGIATEREAW